jgi:hypothetical protein
MPSVNPSGPDRRSRFPHDQWSKSSLAFRDFSFCQFGEIYSSMLQTVNSRVIEVFSRLINGTRLTVQIYSSSNGPDLFLHFVLSHFVISRLWKMVAFLLRTPDSQVPEIFSRHINETRSTVEIYSNTKGLDLFLFFSISHFATLENSCLHASDFR